MRAWIARLAIISIALTGGSGCAHALRSAKIADLRDNPGRYHHHAVSINGVVTSAYSLPLVPYKLYKIDDGTGEVTVVSQNSRTPTKGARVRVRGTVEDVAILGGQSVGLHLREESLYVKQ